MKALLGWVTRLAQDFNLRRDRRFDQAFGIDTVQFVDHRSSDLMSAELRRDAEPYVATSIALFRKIVRRSGIDPAQFAFVDLGAGKGRTLLLAAEQGFASVTGVELDPEMYAIARRNLARWPAGKGRPTIVQGDAREFALPDGDLFVFMFNPFTGDVFAAVAERLAEAARRPGRRMIVAYHNDVCAEALERTGAFHRTRIRPIRFWTHSKLSLFYNQLAWHSKSRRASNSR